MLEVQGYILLLLSVFGVFLNNRKMRLCFVIWFFGNGLAAYIHWQLGAMNVMYRDLIFLALSIDGWRKWGSTK